MKIKGNFIFVKRRGSFIGFIDLGETDINTLNFEKKQDLATHVWCILPGVFFEFKVQFRSVFRTQSSIYDGAFFAKIVHNF